LDKAKRAELKRRFFRELRAQREIEDARPEGSVKVNVNLNTPDGWDYGLIPVYMQPFEPLLTLPHLAREYVKGVIEVPENPKNFVYAGRAYGRNRKLEDLPNFRDGGTIFISF
jgi:hypothetical protein